MLQVNALCLCLFGNWFCISVFVGVKAFAPSLYAPEDTGENAGLPGHCDHYDLDAPQGNTLYGCFLPVRRS